MADLSVWCGHAHPLGCAENPRVEIDGVGRAVDV